MPSLVGQTMMAASQAWRGPPAPHLGSQKLPGVSRMLILQPPLFQGATEVEMEIWRRVSSRIVVADGVAVGGNLCGR